MKFLKPLIVLLFLTSCNSGGGGGDDDNNSSPDPSSDATWKVSAEIAQDGCGERIADVNQSFDVTDAGDSIVVDTGIVTITGTKTEAGFTAGFSETNGTCNRSYTADFQYSSGSAASVNLISNSNCGTVVCTNTWVGTATKVN